MTLNVTVSRPLACLKSLCQTTKLQSSQQRFVSAGYLRYRAPPPEPSRSDPWAPAPPRPKHKIKIYQPPQSIRKTCPEPLRTFNLTQLSLLDPSGARTRLFSPKNLDRAALGDVLLVRFKNGDPFYGVYMGMRRQGPDTAILLRNTLMRVGAEMWVKIYSPSIVGIEIVQRTAKKARRSKLYYLRKPEHDRGDLSNVLNQYLKTRRTLGANRAERRERLEAQKAAKKRAREKVEKEEREREAAAEDAAAEDAAAAAAAAAKKEEAAE